MLKIQILFKETDGFYSRHFYTANSILFSLFAALTFFTLWHHVPWSDEADVWLVARDIPIANFWSQMRYAQVPALWYLAVIALAKGGAPYFSMFLLHWLIACGTVLLILLKSPFAFLTKVFLIFSLMLSHEYAIIARVYGPATFLIFLTAVCYRQRLEKPYFHIFLIFLLFQTTGYNFGFSVGMLASYALEIFIKSRRGELKATHYVVPLLLGCLSMFITIAMLWPQPDAGSMPGKFFSGFWPEQVFSATQQAFLPGYFDKWVIESFPEFWLNFSQALGMLITLGEILSFGVAIGLVVLSIYLAYRKFYPLVIYSGAYFWLSYIFLLKYGSSYRHYALILVYTLFLLWTERDHENLLKPLKLPARLKEKISLPQVEVWVTALLTITLCFNTAMGIKRHIREYEYNFSGSKDMAEFIKNHHYDHAIFSCYQYPLAESVVAYLPETRFWYPALQNFGTYVKWNLSIDIDKKMRDPGALTLTKKQFPDRSNVLMLFSFQVKNNPDLVLLHHSQGDIESFWLYRFQ